MKPLLTAARLRELLHYDPDTGVFTWRVNKGRSVAGSVAGSRHGRGYLTLRIDQRNYLAHRVALLYMTGEWPKLEVDHKSRHKAENRFENLRDISHAGNNQNKAEAQANNLSCGLLGVCRNRSRWAAKIKADGVRHHIGTFDTPELAHAAYLQAKRQLHAGCTI